MYTSHGHHIDGTPTDEPKPQNVARCGGSLLCSACAKETAAGLKLVIFELSEILHFHRLHPYFEYATTTNGRKDGMNFPPDGDGWESNTSYRNGFERFDYHEENYWRREKRK